MANRLGPVESSSSSNLKGGEAATSAVKTGRAFAGNGDTFDEDEGGEWQTAGPRKKKKKKSANREGQARVLSTGGGKSGDAKKQGRVKGKKVPQKASYVCNHCGVPGHFLKDCPNRRGGGGGSGKGKKKKTKKGVRNATMRVEEREGRLLIDHT
tara:strand:+ start:381 stop:842 length:462 start_codon:yes stop_codon:yes gene_type:complete